LSAFFLKINLVPWKKNKKKKKKGKRGQINLFIAATECLWGCGHVRQMLGRRCINK
jgi:hypothetical protein